jgi:hypothetical protein
MSFASEFDRGLRNAYFVTAIINKYPGDVDKQARILRKLEITDKDRDDLINIFRPGYVSAALLVFLLRSEPAAHSTL